MPQILLEFYAVVTNPRREQEQPLTAEEGWRQVELFRGMLRVLDVVNDSLDYVREFIDTHRVKGADIFDAYIAAQMRTLDVSLLCTYNTNDFIRYEGIVPLIPEEILADAP